MCGFVGMVARGDVAAEIHIGLQAIQHRGQDSAGIATINYAGDRFTMRRGLGIAAQALDSDDLSALCGGPIGLGHVRYPTIGQGKLEDAQPFFYRQPGILMAHNGNVTNYRELQQGLAGRSIHLLSRCDVEPALCELADALMRRRNAEHTLDDVIVGLKTVQARVRGAYSIVAALRLDGEPSLVVLRDPRGIRPAIVGRRDDGAWLAASESVALDTLAFERAFEPPAGEAVVLRAEQEPIRVALERDTPAPCVFEHIYFARPDSHIDGRIVYEVRLGFGRALAERVRAKSIEADVVIPVPDTARPAAAAMAELLGLPLREGFIKNRYSGRTFIMPDPAARRAALRLKLNTLPSEIRDRRVLLIDDSIVRGTTLRRVISALRGAGARSVDLAIHSPPVRHPCFYGIDMSTEEELFAERFAGDLPSVELQAAQALGADSLTYLPVEALDESFGSTRCAACFDGCYPTEVSPADREAICADRRVASQR